MKAVGTVQKKQKKAAINGPKMEVCLRYSISVKDVNMAAWYETGRIVGRKIRQVWDGRLERDHEWSLNSVWVGRSMSMGVKMLVLKTPSRQTEMENRELGVILERNQCLGSRWW